MTTLMVSVLAFVSGVKDRLSSEKGATAVEYGLMVSLIAIAIIIAVTAIGTNLDLLFTEVSEELALPPAAP